MNFAAWLCFCLALAAPAAEPNRQLEKIQQRLQSPDEHLRLDALRDVAALPAARRTPVLLEALKNASPAVRAAAVAQLGQRKEPRVIAALRPLLKDDDDRVRASAAWWLCQNAGKEILPDILPLCRDDASGLVRFRAVWGLAFIGDKSALPVVIDALGDYNASVRERAALLALEKLGDDTVPKRLRQQAGHPFAPTRRIVMYLLSKYPDDQTLLAGLSDDDPLVRAEAALSLGKRKLKTAQPALRPLLEDADEHVRGAATYALGLIGDKEALRPMLDDREAFVRAIAAEFLGLKTPEGFKAAELFTYPIHSPEHTELYR